jgi:putative aldouronate transport system substrate-binding protein
MDSREFTGSNGINIAHSVSDPVRAIQYLDWLIDEDVQRFLEWGIEGEHYFYNAEGRIERPQEQRDLQAEQRWGYDNLGRMLRDLMPKMQGSFSDGNPTDPGESPEEYFAGLNDYDRALFDKLGIKTQTGLMTLAGDEPVGRPLHYPYWSMSMDDGSPESLANQRLEDIRVNYLARLVIAPEGRFDDLWDEYVAAVEAVDQQPIFDFFTAEGNRRVAAATGG